MFTLLSEIATLQDANRVVQVLKHTFTLLSEIATLQDKDRCSKNCFSETAVSLMAVETGNMGFMSTETITV